MGILQGASLKGGALLVCGRKFTRTSQWKPHLAILPMYPGVTEGIQPLVSPTINYFEVVDFSDSLLKSWTAFE